jgi:hypothetical protein
VDVRIRNCCFLALAMLLGLSHYGLGADVKLLLVDSGTGRPLHGKGVCVSFSPNPNATGIDRPNVCHETNSKGTMKIALPNPTPQSIHVSVMTNFLVPCFSIPHAFLTAELTAAGTIAPNTCSPPRSDVTTQPGMIVLFAHQMTFAERWKWWWQELW